MKKKLVEYAVFIGILLFFNILFRWIGWFNQISYLATFLAPLLLALLHDVIQYLKKNWQFFHQQKELQGNEKVTYSGVQVFLCLFQDMFFWCKHKLKKLYGRNESR